MPPKGTKGKKPKPNTIFKPVQVRNEYVLVVGGYNRVPVPALFRKKTVPGLAAGSTEDIVFLKVTAREPWLIAGASGHKQISEGLSNRTTLVEELREKLYLATGWVCGRKESTASSCTDPMAEVADDEVLITSTIKKVSAKRTRWIQNPGKDTIMVVPMPERAPEMGIDAGIRHVQLYCEDRKTIWLCTKDADWALQYLRDQLDCKGVQKIAPDDRGPGAGPAPPVHVCEPAQPAQAGPPVVAGAASLEDGVHTLVVDVDVSAELSFSINDPMAEVADYYS
jgi:hypothetical protein